MCHGTEVLSITYHSTALTAITNLGNGNAEAFPDEGINEWQKPTALRLEIIDRIWMTRNGCQEMDHGRRMTISLLPFMKILRLCEVLPFSRSITFISSYEVTIECRYPDTRCTTGGIAPPTTIQSTIQSTIQRYRIQQLHARVTCRMWC
jgi:hypothetical protein